MALWRATLQGLEGVPAEARMLAGKLNAQTLIVEGAGHFPLAEMPERVAPKVVNASALVGGRANGAAACGRNCASTSK